MKEFFTVHYQLGAILAIIFTIVCSSISLYFQIQDDNKKDQDNEKL